jgi:hypothetical protein
MVRFDFTLIEKYLKPVRPEPIGINMLQFVECLI